MVERSWDPATNTSNTALLVIMNFPTRSPVRGWTSKITFSKNITDVEFASVSARLIQTDVATGSVVFSSNAFNAQQDGKIFAFLIRVTQPWNYDILSDKAGFI